MPRVHSTPPRPDRLQGKSRGRSSPPPVVAPSTTGRAQAVAPPRSAAAVAHTIGGDPAPGNARASTGAARPAGALRVAPPTQAELSLQRAVAFVDAFNRRLGLTGDRLDDKSAAMLTDAHAFFRALPSLFVADISRAWRDAAVLIPGPAPVVPTLFDFHLGNLGTFRAHGRVVWGPNDYDQAGRGDPSVDILRGGTSTALLMRARGASDKQTARVLDALLSAYGKEIARAAEKGPRVGPFLTRKEAPNVIVALLEDVRDRDADWLLRRHVVKDAFALSAQLLPLLGPARALVSRAFAEVAPEAHIVDVAERMGAGGSSRGLPRYWALAQHGKERILLELKLAPPSPHQPARATFDARAVCALQAEVMGDAMSTWTRPGQVGRRSFLLREVDAVKASLDLADLSRGDIEDLVEAAGTAAARVHGAQQADAAALARWLLPAREGAAERLATFAIPYSAHVAAQHAACCAARAQR